MNCSLSGPGWRIDVPQSAEGLRLLDFAADILRKTLAAQATIEGGAR